MQTTAIAELYHQLLRNEPMPKTRSTHDRWPQLDHVLCRVLVLISEQTSKLGAKSGMAFPDLGIGVRQVRHNFAIKEPRGGPQA
jgi:hypothetical protein